MRTPSMTARALPRPSVPPESTDMRRLLPAVGRSPFARFLLVGGVSYVVNQVLLVALNDRWTFRDRHSKSLASRFYQSNFTSFGSPLICLAAVNVLTPYFGVSYL